MQTPEIQIKDSRLSLSMESIIGAMDIDQKREVLSWIATDDEVINSVVDVICGEDALGWAIGDPNRRQSILHRIEEKQLEDSPRFLWKPWDDLRAKIKDIRTEEHLYWILYHKIDGDLSQRVFEELRRLGIKDNYTSHEADAEIALIKDGIKTAFEAMNKTQAASL